MPPRMRVLASVARRATCAVLCQDDTGADISSNLRKLELGYSFHDLPPF